MLGRENGWGALARVLDQARRLDALAVRARVANASRQGQEASWRAKTKAAGIKRNLAAAQKFLKNQQAMSMNVDDAQENVAAF